MARLLHEVRHIPWHNDQELVRAVRGGDDSAFEELFSRYQGRIGAYVTRILGDPDRAEDVTQEVFVSALRRLRDTESPVAFKPWAYQIAKNASIDELRRTRRSQELPLDQERDGTDGKLELLSAELSPQAAVESKQRLEDLRAAFGGLSDLHHRILVLRELEGLTYSEIGERLGMSRAVVESTLFRARRRLVEEYQELISGERCETTRAAIDGREGRPWRRIGIRERRRVARHLAHCRVCRRHAFLAEIEGAVPRVADVRAGGVGRPADSGGAMRSSAPVSAKASGTAGAVPAPIPLAGRRRSANREAAAAPKQASRAVA